MIAYFGTGFAVNQQGYYLTAAHVVNKGNTFNLFVKGKVYPATLVAVDKNNDEALLYSNFRSTAEVFFPLKAELHGACTIYGYPEYIKSNIPNFIFYKNNGYCNLHGYSVNISNSNICKENSGGPVVNSMGQLEGNITHQSVGGFQCWSSGYGVSVYETIKFLNAEHVRYKYGALKTNVFEYYKQHNVVVVVFAYYK